MSGEGTRGNAVALTMDRAERIESAFSRLRAPHAERVPSDLTFFNLYLFREAHDYTLRRGELEVIEGRAYDGARIVIPLFDIASVGSAELVALQGDSAWFYPMPAAVVARMEPQSVHIDAMREDADYLYDAECFLDYTRVGLGPKRHGVERLREQGRIDSRSLDAHTLPAALEVLDGWCVDRGVSAGAADVNPCGEALEWMANAPKRLPHRGWVHFVDEIPAGLLIAEELNPGVLAVRFAKGRVRFDGIYAHMFQDLVRRYEPAPRFLNFEQDLGNANFRRTKLSFRPRELIEKFRMRIRTDK